jgi:hypothetical protein
VYARYLEDKENNASVANSKVGILSWGHIPMIVRRVQVHAKEKLLRLLPEGWISTAPGRAIAEPLHDQMVEYLKVYQGTDLLKQ